MNCSNCGKPLPEIGELELSVIMGVKRVCSCGTVYLIEFVQPMQSKLGHVATIRFGSQMVRTPIIGEWRDRWNRRYFYVAIHEESEKRFLSFAENSFSLQGISAYPMQMSENHKAMARAIAFKKRINRWQRIANRYLPYEDANRSVIVAFNITGQASFRDEFDYEFNEGDLTNRATAIAIRDYYISQYNYALQEAGLV